MSAMYGMSLPARPDDRHPLRTIREIRESLPDDQLVHFGAETDISELESTLTRWATLANDGFMDFLLSTPFEGVEFGARSYDERQGGE
ncbi:hypothetical protein ACIHFD_23910 [Nonomuraea sp. NPDC051941]|uniref:hypothetical protein n=1 Tax=Nonomuraea sp. NPDC051941 TaxID=3364373 RepID=UPI0037CB8400